MANKRFHTDRAQVLFFRRFRVLTVVVFQTLSRFGARRVKRGVGCLALYMPFHSIQKVNGRENPNEVY